MLPAAPREMSKALSPVSIRLVIRRDAMWASPAFPDTFGKLMNLLEVSDAEKAIYGGVQG